MSTYLYNDDICLDPYRGPEQFKGAVDTAPKEESEMSDFMSEDEANRLHKGVAGEMKHVSEEQAESLLGDAEADGFRRGSVGDSVTDGLSAGKYSVHQVTAILTSMRSEAQESADFNRGRAHGYDQAIHLLGRIK